MINEFDRLTLERSHPVQNQTVHVQVLWNDKLVGHMAVPFAAWLKIKRLIEKGVEIDGREDHALKLKFQIRGRQSPDDHAFTPIAIANQIFDAEEAADLAAIEYEEQARAQAQPEQEIRSLRKEVIDGD